MTRHKSGNHASVCVWVSVCVRFPSLLQVRLGNKRRESIGNAVRADDTTLARGSVHIWSEGTFHSTSSSLAV